MLGVGKNAKTLNEKVKDNKKRKNSAFAFFGTCETVKMKKYNAMDTNNNNKSYVNVVINILENI